MGLAMRMRLDSVVLKTQTEQAVGSAMSEMFSSEAASASSRRFFGFAPGLLVSWHTDF